MVSSAHQTCTFIQNQPLRQNVLGDEFRYKESIITLSYKEKTTIQSQLIQKLQMISPKYH